jgi:thioredoxin reductase
VTHTSQHHDLGTFKGRKVAVIGAGASAADVAGLLHEAGAEAHLIARGSLIPFHTKMRLPRPLYDQLRNPLSKIGPGWRSVFFTKFPHLFRLLPETRRLHIVRTYLGPAPGYFMRDRVIGKLPVHCGLQVMQAKPNAGGVLLTLVNESGEKREFQADHVVCGTGYKSELARLPFLDETLLSRINAVEGTPVLSANFESSVPGLYFVGAIAANTFGPVLRFACGAEFAAPRVARHLSRRRKSLASSRVTESGLAMAQAAKVRGERS